MAKQQTEDELNIKRRARRRLVGAIALTLAVVVILPMVLDSEPKPTGKDMDLRIPAADKVGEFVPGVALSDVVKQVETSESAVPENTGVVSGVISTPVVKASDPLPVVEPAAKAEPVRKPEPPATPEPPAAKAESVKVDKKADAGKAAGKYVVQVGAYSNAGAAEQEAGKLKAWGFKAYTEKINGTVRVRVGPYPDRDNADRVRKLLENHGLHSVISVNE